MNDRLKQPPAVAATDPRAQGLTLAEIREQRRHTEDCRSRLLGAQPRWPQAEWGKIHAEIFENGRELCVGLRHEDQHRGRGIILSVEECGQVVRQFVQWCPECLEPPFSRNAAGVRVGAAAEDPATPGVDDAVRRLQWVGGFLEETARADLEKQDYGRSRRVGEALLVLYRELGVLRRAEGRPSAPSGEVAPPPQEADGFARDAKDLAGARVGDALEWLHEVQMSLAGQPGITELQAQAVKRIGDAVFLLKQEHAVIHSVLGWPSDCAGEAPPAATVNTTGGPDDVVQGAETLAAAGFSDGVWWLRRVQTILRGADPMNEPARKAAANRLAEAVLVLEREYAAALRKAVGQTGAP